jgi:hypothetical protein
MQKCHLASRADWTNLFRLTARGKTQTDPLTNSEHTCYTLVTVKCILRRSHIYERATRVCSQCPRILRR